MGPYPGQMRLNRFGRNEQACRHLFDRIPLHRQRKHFFLTRTQHEGFAGSTETHYAILKGTANIATPLTLIDSMPL